MPRGKLIVLEGLDRAGKSTQCEFLVERLKKEGGGEVRYMRFPDRTTPIGQMINGYLSGQSEQEDHVIHLLFSANRWEAAANIQSLIENGTNVVIDRYYYSGCVYSAAKQNPSLPLSWCRHPDVGLPRPDLCLFLDISAEAAAKRGGYGTEKYEKKEMQDRVRSLFDVLIAGGETGEGEEKEDIVKIDASGNLEEVRSAVWEEARKVLERVDGEGAPLRFVGKW
ncbi:thymidylate kinase [Periconia macrospinosa]|uniref:Thymidylate kinase n=1 Tax=Periconia macrospinosa TaxID=97972 RepID=A0A2V1E5W1_9PLEO|nr:thymidylate kinase [Periconia macrospinosa]